jgi:predicted nucleotidyltransferase
MSKRVRIQNLIKLLRDGNLPPIGIRAIEIRGKGFRLEFLLKSDIDVFVELEGDFSGNQLHRELKRLGLI